MEKLIKGNGEEQAYLQRCPDVLPEEAQIGIRLFNEGRFYEAHEHLELAWRAEASPRRYLYIGILQAGVAYYHIQQNNYRGALKVIARSRRWLNQLPEWCGGVHVAKLRADLDKVEAEVRKLGPQGLKFFDPHLFCPLELRPL
ncbi:MAG: DUF309 domain-containing protein [Anaerolineales bacterium]|nr:DUF309 domain-containing protein [Anaerolineales bacterium]MDW8446272.1 DUF309 domain-containing protein [Anaerolineales bacterium]